jgi:membrane protease YdiL (CAAX protease family)
MQFLVDPAAVRLDASAWVFIALLCVALPVAAVLQHVRRAAGEPLPTRPRIYVSAIITHAVFLGIVWLVAWHLRLSLFPSYRPRAIDVGIGLAALAVGLIPLIPRFRLDNKEGEARARLIAPQSQGEHALFYVLCVSAGVAEESAYRGMLFVLLAALLRGWWLAAIIAAAAFGVVHLFQGWKSAGVAALMGLREHIVVGLTGTLTIAIVVHMLHDAIAGTVIAREARHEQAAAA